MKNNNSDGNRAGNANASVDISALLKRLDELKSQVETLKDGKNAPVKNAGNGKKAKDAPETWETAGKSAENTEANLYGRRVSVQVQRSSKGREQVHIYTQSLIPADRVRNSAGLDKVKAKDGNGKTIEAVWVNNAHPVIVRAKAKDAQNLLSALIATAAK
jgi:hypothetical protein